MSTELLSVPLASDLDVTHKLGVTWQHPDTRSIQPVGLLTCNTSGWEFAYLRVTSEVTDFQPFLGFPDLEQRYSSRALFPLFAQRVMRPSRPDYARYLRSLALGDAASAWSILARSQGARVGDTIRVFPEPEVDDSGRTRSTFFANGIRHRLRNDSAVGPTLDALTPGTELTLVDEPDNPVNPLAIQLTERGGVALGWVPDVLLDYVRTVRAVAEPTVTVVAVNGPDVPPGFRLLVTLAGTAPAGYRAFSGPRWETATPAPC